MTTSFQQFKNWISKEEGLVSADFTTAEATLTDFFGPLFKQILKQAIVIGKGDITAGLQVLKDATAVSVQAGVAAIAAGQSPVAAAEAQFIATTVSEGTVAVSNAESSLIKAGVAIFQQDSAAAVQAISTAASQAIGASPTTVG